MLRNTIRSHFLRRFYQTSTSNQINSSKLTTKRVLLATIVGSIAYDGFNEFEICGGISRFLRSLRIAAQISFDYSWHLYGVSESDEGYDDLIKQINLRSANRLLNGCLANGGLYIKIGQRVSAINHILPIEYTKTLKQLEDKCLPRQKDEVRRIFEQEFQQTPDDLFAEFDYEPVAAASLAQVFRAKTKTGQDVAVKVQYIDLIKRFSGDFATILFLQDLIKIIHSDYNFGWILRDLRANLEQELDFIHEGQNSERCAKDLKKLKFVRVPSVDWDLTTKRILTTEWIDGYKITDMDKIQQDKLDLADVDRKLFQIFSEQIFHTGFVHADPHPGNVFVCRDKKSGKPQLVLLDHGLYEHLPDNVRLSLCQFWEAIVLKDQTKMDKYAKELNVKDSNKLAEILLQRPIDMKTPSFKARLSDEDIAYFQNEAKKHFDVVLETLKLMPRNMLFVVRNLNTIRAIARHHGDPIDRPTYMAQYAQRCIHNVDKFSIIQRIKLLIRRIRFDFHLYKIAFQFWLIRTYLDGLACLGLSAADSKTILSTHEQTNDI